MYPVVRIPALAMEIGVSVEQVSTTVTANRIRICGLDTENLPLLPAESAEQIRAIYRNAQQPTTTFIPEHQRPWTFHDDREARAEHEARFGPGN